VQPSTTRVDLFTHIFTRQPTQPNPNQTTPQGPSHRRPDPRPSLPLLLHVLSRRHPTPHQRIWRPAPLAQPPRARGRRPRQRRGQRRLRGRPPIQLCKLHGAARRELCQHRQRRQQRGARLQPWRQLQRRRPRRPQHLAAAVAAVPGPPSAPAVAAGAAAAAAAGGGTAGAAVVRAQLHAHGAGRAGARGV